MDPLRECSNIEKKPPQNNKIIRKIFRRLRIRWSCVFYLLRRTIKIRFTKHPSTLLLLFLLIVQATSGSKSVSRRKRYNPTVFPSNSEIETNDAPKCAEDRNRVEGVAWEMGIPIGLEGKDVEVGLFLEADYSLPDNITYLYPNNFLNIYTGKRRRRWSNRRRRSAGKRKGGPVTREAAFIAIETTMYSLGMDGHDCLLRSICESADTPLYSGSLVAELLHVLFTPSTTVDNELDGEYLEAEELGKSGGDCYKAYSSCTKGLFDMITTLEYEDF